jgi:hypothetical protein
MPYKPGTYNLELNQASYQADQGPNITIPVLDNYDIFYTSVNTKSNGKIRLPGTTTEGPGYRIDIADKRDILAVNDKVKIGSTVYGVKEVVTPEFSPDTGKILSPQLISDNPIEVFPATKRTYRFDISININDV